jgi:hypothetical protein
MFLFETFHATSSLPPYSLTPPPLSYRPPSMPHCSPARRHTSIAWAYHEDELDDRKPLELPFLSPSRPSPFPFPLSICHHHYELVVAIHRRRSTVPQFDSPSCLPSPCAPIEPSRTTSRHPNHPCAIFFSRAHENAAMSPSLWPSHHGYSLHHHHRALCSCITLLLIGSLSFLTELQT